MNLAHLRRCAAGVAAAIVLCASGPAAAQTPVPLTVSGREATGIISLPGGVGAELTLAFEEVVGLNPAALEVSARLITPLDVEFLARLAEGGVALPAAFPVAISIEPSAGSALSFSGVVSVSLHTHSLHLVPAVPLALHSAHGGGVFRDITATEGIGSYRAGGTGGGFSEFTIVVDPRPIDSIIELKFAALEGLLAAHAASIPADVLALLSERLAQARAQHQAGQTVAAIGTMTAFGSIVRAHSGAEIPDVWRAHDPRPNVAGLLRAGADTVKFSLARKSGQ
jgi:hypothetical protein